MAVKKSKPAEVKAKPAPAKKVAAKPKKVAAAKPKEAKPVVASDTASKAETPKPTAAAPKKAAVAVPKKAAPAPVKLTENQLKFLKQIHETKEGYLTAKKAEQKTIETLLVKKLIKKGAKDKTSGNFRYTVSKAGEKHLSTNSPA
jgi:hypothetical protein